MCRIGACVIEQLVLQMRTSNSTLIRPTFVLIPTGCRAVPDRRLQVHLATIGRTATTCCA